MIESFKINNLTAFKELEWKDVKPLNVIIGLNDTGKTHLMKLLYAFVKSLEEWRRGGVDKPANWSDSLSLKLRTVFLPHTETLGALVRRGESKLALSARFMNENFYFSFGKDTTFKISDYSPERFTENRTKEPDAGNPKYLFFPPKEVLTVHRALYAQQQEVGYQAWGFDATYHDLIAALINPGVSGRTKKVVQYSQRELVKVLKGMFILDNQDFVFKPEGSNEKLRMWQTPEGLKKLGHLSLLIHNRSILKGSILFFDEPEANLHPKAVRIIAKILFGFAQEGVQIFLATHSYFIIKQIEMLARENKVSVSFCSLNKSVNGIEARFSDLCEELPENPIIDESVALFQDDIELEFKRPT